MPLLLRPFVVKNFKISFSVHQFRRIRVLSQLLSWTRTEDQMPSVINNVNFPLLNRIIIHTSTFTSLLAIHFRALSRLKSWSLITFHYNCLMSRAFQEWEWLSKFKFLKTKHRATEAHHNSKSAGTFDFCCVCVAKPDLSYGRACMSAVTDAL